MKVDHLPFQRRKRFIMQRTSLWKRRLWQKSKYEMKDWFEFTRFFLLFLFSYTMPLFQLLDIFFSPKSCKKINVLLFAPKPRYFQKNRILFVRLNEWICLFSLTSLFNNHFICYIRYFTHFFFWFLFWSTALFFLF